MWAERRYPKKINEAAKLKEQQERGRKMTRDNAGSASNEESDREVDARIKRLINPKRRFNNSYTRYMPNLDLTEIDKGANPQFLNFAVK